MKHYTLITGASGGIGKELAHICAKHKENLILVARSKDKLKSLKEALEKQHKIDVIVHSFDLSEESSWQALSEKTHNKEVTTLINNAGFGDYGPFLKRDWKKESNMIDLNIKALTWLSKHYGKRMQEKQSGKIMNIASTAAFQPGPLMAVYYATKAYVLSFSEGLAEELRADGISVTAYCPGPTRTDFESNADLGSSQLFKNASLPTADEVAKDAYKAMQKGTTVAVHGFRNKIMVFLERFVPRSFVRKTVMRVQGKA